LTTRIAIVEDDARYRAGLAAILGEEPSFRVEDSYPRHRHLRHRVLPNQIALQWKRLIQGQSASCCGTQAFDA
jgi:hypothetical protein